METQLRHDMRGQGHTLLRGRAKFSNDEDVTFRLYTTVNITSSAVLLDGYLRKFFGIAGRVRMRLHIVEFVSLRMSQIAHAGAHECMLRVDVDVTDESVMIACVASVRFVASS